MLLALKTADKISEIYILDDDTTARTVLIEKEKKWEAGRELARNLLGEIEKLLTGLQTKSGTTSKNVFDNLTGIIVFQGPGSFTGLRIGITTANAIAYAEEIPIVGASGEDWLKKGAEKLRKNQNDKIVLPEYGASPHITAPKK
jgi:tRNA threonylcarbamoyladenosine biosynthesis protein TsaB